MWWIKFFLGCICGGVVVLGALCLCLCEWLSIQAKEI
jgi:hypothetical protein